MEPYSIDELYAGLQSTRLESEPGVRWSYSNLGYALLGHVLERASGEDFRSLLREELFGPLSMGDSGVTPTPEHEERLAVHYWPEDDVRTPRERWRMGEVVSAMGVYSNVQDLGRFLAALVEPEGPWVPIAAEMQTARVETGQQAGRQMSLGWLIDRVPGLGVVLGYGGEVDGHSGCIAFVPGAGAGLVVLCNQGDDSAEAVLRALMPLFVPQVLADGSAASTSDASNSAADPEAPIGQGGHGGR